MALPSATVTWVPRPTTAPARSERQGRPSWDAGFAAAPELSPRCHQPTYNSLLDPSLRAFFAKSSNRAHLLHAGFVSKGGVIVSNPEDKIKRATEAEAALAAADAEQENQIHRALTARAVKTKRLEETREKRERWLRRYADERGRRDRSRVATAAPDPTVVAPPSGFLSRASSTMVARPPSAAARRAECAKHPTGPRGGLRESSGTPAGVANMLIVGSALSLPAAPAAAH
jgi:hypothetical protein